jgi:hypothetical protein
MGRDCISTDPKLLFTVCEDNSTPRAIGPCALRLREQFPHEAAETDAAYDAAVPNCAAALGEIQADDNDWIDF